MVVNAFPSIVKVRLLDSTFTVIVCSVFLLSDVKRELILVSGYFSAETVRKGISARSDFA